MAPPKPDHLVSGDFVELKLPSRYLASLKEECMRMFERVPDYENAQEALECSLADDWTVVPTHHTKLYITRNQEDPRWVDIKGTNEFAALSHRLTRSDFTQIFNCPSPSLGETLTLEIRSSLSEPPSPPPKPLGPSPEQTQEALDSCADIKWYSIAFGDGIDNGRSNCALCKLFPVVGCKEGAAICPVRIKTGGACHGPWSDWFNHYTSKHNSIYPFKRQPSCPECNTLATAVYRFQLDLAREFRETGTIKPLETTHE